MKLRWTTEKQWHYQTTHRCETSAGKYRIRHTRGSSHYAVYFTPSNEKNGLDIGFDEPWTLRHAKKQCQAHHDLGSPSTIDYDAIMKIATT